MTAPRTTFRKVTPGGKTYLYPFPVIKENKYLIEVHKEHAEFFMNSLAKGYLTSPDTTQDYLEKIGIHTDNQTPIYKLVPGKLTFQFLPDRNKDLTKAANVEKVLAKAIVAYLTQQPDSHEKLKTRFEAQLDCSTCQALGIQSQEVRDWMDLLL